MKKTTLCYIEQNQSYLMLYRNKKEKDPNEGKWIGLGGKIEPGETPDECVVREVFEEAGVVLTSYTYRGLIHFVSDVFEDEDMYLYTATGYTGTIRSDCAEGTLKWIPKEEVNGLTLWEGDRVFLQYLLEDRMDLCLTLRYQGETLVEVISE